MNRPHVIMTAHTPRAGRTGRRTGWPVSVGLAYWGGRPPRVRGVYCRVGSTTVIAGWWPKTRQRGDGYNDDEGKTHA